jgi:hypothetical protein
VTVGAVTRPFFTKEGGQWIGAMREEDVRVLVRAAVLEARSRSAYDVCNEAVVANVMRDRLCRGEGCPSSRFRT